MNVLSRVQKLCKQHKVGIAKMERDIQISKGASYKWKNSDPSMEILKKLSEYFNVSADYILHGSKEENVNIDNDIQNLISKLTGDNSIYFSGKEMTEEGKLALLNSLKQDLQFLNALHSKDEWED